MKIHQVDQNTLDWMMLHIGIPTASGLEQLVDTSFVQRKGEMPRSYMFKKLAEAYRGKPLSDMDSRPTGGFSAEQGMIVEEEARPFFALETNKTVKRVGFITTDDGLFGCSPDGLILDQKGGPVSGVEIKCPSPWVHVKYLIGGIVPNDYIAQVHGSMYATGFKNWWFMSYRRGFPALILEVERDEEIIVKIKLAIEKFHEDFSKAKERMKQIDVGKLK